MAASAEASTILMAVTIRSYDVARARSGAQAQAARPRQHLVRRQMSRSPYRGLQYRQKFALHRSMIALRPFFSNATSSSGAFLIDRFVGTAMALNWIRFGAT